MNKKHLWLAGACLLAVGGCSNDSEMPDDAPENSEHQDERAPESTEVYRNDYNYVYSEVIQIRLTMYIHSKLLTMSTQLTLLTDLLEHDRYGQLSWSY